MDFAEVSRITELFEAVLVHLSQRDLLLVQRVCRRWREFITKSPTLQQKLFFQPNLRATEPELNPLLREVFPPFFVLEEVPCCWTNTRYCNTPREIAQLGWYKDESRRAKVMNENASWRRMFAVQPPAKIEKVVELGGCQCGGQRSRYGTPKKEFWEQEKDGGVRMGGLWDLVVYLVDGAPAEAGFFVEWMMFEVMAKVHEEDDLEWEESEGEQTELERDITADAQKGWRVIGPSGNAITVHIEFSRECFAAKAAPCGLLITECDEGTIKWKGESK